MPVPTVTLNGLPLHQVGFIVADVPQFLQMPTRAPVTALLPGRFGGLVLDASGTQLREMLIEGAFVRDTVSLREAAEDTLKERLLGHLIEVRVRRADGQVRVTHGVLSGDASHGTVGPLFRARGSRLTLPLVCPDATWRAEEPVLLPLSDTPQAVPAWGAPTDAIIRVYGPGTDCALEFRTAGGLVTTEMALGSLDADQYLEIDGSAETLLEVTAGVVANGLSRLGDDPFPEFGLTPRDGEGQTVTLVGGATGDLWAWPRWT
jgi:hypothetical protein